MIFKKLYIKFKKNITVVLVNIALCELFLAAYVNLNKDIYLSTDHKYFYPDKNAQIKLEKYFDPVLGWKPPVNTALGERPQATSGHYKNTFASTFGDSFTWGSQVSDAETWQSFLENKVNAKVLNFGVESYGVDQAVKYFTTIKDKLPDSNYVILGFIDDDLKRNMTGYRKFQQRFQYDFPFTKPRYELQNGQLIYIKNPSQNFEEALQLSEPQHLEELMKKDWFYSRYKKPEFPYLLNFVGPTVLHLIKGFPSDSPFLDPDMKNLFKALLDLFKQEAASKKMNIVVVRFPTYLMFNIGPAGYLIPNESKEFMQAELEFNEICRSLKIKCYYPLKDLVKKGISPEDFQEGNGNHYSAKGNRLFAEVLYNYLSNIKN